MLFSIKTNNKYGKAAIKALFNVSENTLMREYELHLTGSEKKEIESHLQAIMDIVNRK